MSLSVAAALRDGLGRTVERNGLQLIAAFFGLQLATTVATDTLTRANIELAGELGADPVGGPAGDLLPAIGDAPTPYAIGLGLLASLVLVLAVALLAEAARIVAVRTFAGDRVDAVPAAAVRRNIGVATLNGFAGGLVVLTLTGLGLIALVLPGVFLALSFFFVRQEIAARDVNFVDAMVGSWRLATGNRLALFALAATIVVAGLVAAIPGFVVTALSPTAGSLVGAATRAVVVVFGIASVTRAYAQLREREEDDEPDDPFEAALTADDLPPPATDGDW